MFWIFAGIGLFFILIGLSVHKLKWHFLIAGYNTMSKEEQAKVDIARVGKILGIFSYVNGAAFILLGILLFYGIESATIPIFAFFFISLVYVIIKAQKYDRNTFDEQGKRIKGKSKRFYAPIIKIGITLVLVFGLMFYFSQDTKVTFLDEGIKIHGMYGDVYTWDSITSVELKENLPTIEVRTNGADIGANLRGHFRTKEFGGVVLSVNKKHSPFIYLYAQDKLVIFNHSDPEQTKETFAKIYDQVFKQ